MKARFFFSVLLLSATLTAPLHAKNYPTPIDVVKAYFAAVDAGNADGLAGLVSESLTVSTPMSPQPMNKQMWLGTMRAFKMAFPDMKHEISATIESGFLVSVSGVFKGQNNGSLMGNPATGNRVSAPFNAFIELDKSWKIKSINSQFDMKGFETQLMAGLPDPKAAAEATVRGMLAAGDAGDLDKFMSYCTANSTHYFQGKSTAGEDLKKRIAAFKTGFPDIKRGVDELIVSGNTVVVRGVVSGTNTGPFAGNPATGKAAKVSWVGIYKLDTAGKVAEGWVEFDRATVEMQLKDDAAKGK